MSVSLSRPLLTRSLLTRSLGASHSPRIRLADQLPQPVSRMLRSIGNTLLPPTRTKAGRKEGWKAGLSHAPFVIEGDRVTYSLAIRRRGPNAAWCKDWEGLERSLLDVQ